MGQISNAREILTAQPMGVSFTSPSIDARQARSLFLRLVTSASAGLTGTASVETSTDGITWAILGALSAAITTDGVTDFDIQTTGAPLFRIRWVNTGGTGLGSINVNLKIEG